MALTVGQRSTITTWLAGAWTKIQARQAAYLADRGRYRQFKFSHTVAPQNAASVIPNNLTDQPTNEGDGVTLTHANGGLGWPVRVRVDVYDGPAGQGYVATAQARGSTGERWEVARQVGPETWRERALAQV